MRSTIKRGYWSGRKCAKTQGIYLLKWCSYRYLTWKLRKVKVIVPLLRLRLIVNSISLGRSGAWKTESCFIIRNKE